jgi:hypothetical protein
VEGSCEGGNEPSGSIKRWLACVAYFLFLKMESVRSS